MRKHGVLRRVIGRKIGVMFRILSYPMATQQRQHGLISDEYGFLVGSRRLEQGIESVDDKVQRIIEFLEKNAKPVRLVNSQTVAQNQVAKDVSKLVTLTEKSHKEIQKTKVANSQTLRNGGNIKNRQADENSNLSANQPTRTVNSQTGATNASESAGSLATELSANQPTRTVNSQTSQQAQDRRRDANGRFIGGEGEQSKSSGGLFKGMTQAVRNGFLQANSDGQNLDPSIDALYEVKNILSPVGRVAALTLRPLGALFKSKKRNEPLSREEEKHNKKEIKLLERIARMGGGGGGLLGGLLGRGGGFLGKLFKGGGKLLKFGKGIPLVGALLTAMSFSGWSGKSTKEKGSTVGVGVGGIAGGAIGSLLGPVGTIVGASVGAWVGDKLGGVVAPYFKVWTDSLVKADIPAMLSKAWDGFISLIKKAFEATPFGAAQKGGSKLLEWGRGAYNTVKGTMSEAYRDTVGDSGQSAGKTSVRKIEKVIGVQGTKRIYQMSDGTIETRDSGTVAWRNNNPGNLKFGFKGSADKTVKTQRTREKALADAQKRYKGIVDLDQWGNAVFETQEAGALAKLQLLKNSFGNLTFPEMLRKYAVDDYSGKTDYQRYEGIVDKHAKSNGISLRNKTINQMSKEELDILSKAMVEAEGVKAGNVSVKGNPQATPKATALPPTISKPPVVPSLSLKPAINMKAQPIQFRSAAKVEAIPKIETVPEMHTSPKPMLVQSVNSGDNISQNLSDRGLAHLVTGGLGENRYGA